MTTERVVYLAKCSKREKWIRDNIAYYKQQLKIYKRAKLTNDGGEFRLRKQIRNTKRYLTTYRHELHRIRDMDRVVVPRKAYIGYYGDMGGLCKCGKYIVSSSRCCSRCGRKILWWKVKK